MGEVMTRFYDITVSATDSAGNTDSDTCRVIIVPSCGYQDPGCEKYAESSRNAETESYFTSIAAVEESVALSQVLYESAQQKLVWQFELQKPQAPRRPPQVSGKSGKQPIVKTELVSTSGLDIGMAGEAVDMDNDPPFDPPNPKQAEMAEEENGLIDPPKRRRSAKG